MTTGRDPGGKMVMVAREFFLLLVMDLPWCSLVTRGTIGQVFESSSYRVLLARCYTRKANLCSSGWTIAVLATKVCRAGLDELLPT